MKFPSVQNIIFDLGGVILNIDPDLTLQAFAKISGKPVSEVIQIMQSKKAVMQQYEIGAVNDQELKENLLHPKVFQVTDQQFEEAWNMLLLDIPKERIDLLLSLKNNYRLFLLSNTNHLHWKRFNEILNSSTHLSGFKSLFEEVYYSFELRMRKPDHNIYAHILQDKKLIPAQTAFIDDLDENVQAALDLGMQGVKVERNQLPLDLFV